MTPDASIGGAGESQPWEHGSFAPLPFHLPSAWSLDSPSTPWPSDALYFGSARQALAALVANGHRTRGWRRLWVPRYFCHDALAPLLERGVGLIGYPDHPGLLPLRIDPANLREHDAVLVANLLGLRCAPTGLRLALGEADVIEDHTHDPWSPWAYKSDATYCVASLRKTLPLPDGAVLWSPVQAGLPRRPRPASRAAAASNAWAAAMVLKGAYLAGAPIEKASYRQLAAAGESALAAADPSAMSEMSRALLQLYPAGAWRQTRRRNFEALAGLLREFEDVAVLSPEGPAAVPFAVTTVLPSPSARDQLRARLIDRDVYPAVLWPLEQDHVVFDVGKEELDLSRRVLSLACDARYGVFDLERVAAAVHESLPACRSSS